MEQEPIPELSMHALSGVSHPDIIGLLGELARRKITVLVDPGSTHNFIDERLVQKAKIPIIIKKGLRVMVATHKSNEWTHIMILKLK